MKIIKKHKKIFGFFLFWFIIFVLLAFFRDSRLDENIYLADSVEISNILERGEWIGNYGVGLHGFINKLILGLVFIYTGPSIFIATMFNIIFALSSGLLFYKLLIKHFQFSLKYSLLGTTLLFTSYQFLMYTPTFYRDIPALFFFLLLIELIFEKRSKWLVGIVLLLLLDAKEHVFFTIAPAIVVWLGIKNYLTSNQDKKELFKNFIIENLKLFLPSFVFLVLMFTTSLIPLNIYNANILGLIEGGIQTATSNFDLDKATYNRDVAVNPGVARSIPKATGMHGDSPVESFAIEVINIFLSYLGKISYPRTFSFLSIPTIILIPSLATAIRSLKSSVREDISKLFLIVALLVYIVIYILHSSIGRYLIPISPIVYIFFLKFLQEMDTDKSYFMRVILLTSIFVILGLFFEYSYLYIKIAVNLTLLIIYLFIILNKIRFKEKFKILIVIIICLFSFGSSILASFLYGQIRGYTLYGYNRESAKITSLIDDNDTIWINDIGWDRLPYLLREENIGQAEWKWELRKWIPKKHILKSQKVCNTYNFYWSKEEDFRSKITKNKVNKIVYVKLAELNKTENLLLQDRIDLILRYEWLRLIKEQDMINKTVYVFEVIE